jgi:hypothetical protein
MDCFTALAMTSLFMESAGKQGEKKPPQLTEAVF